MTADNQPYVNLEPGMVVNSVVAGICHHHATGHDGGGGGDDYQCDGCGFEVVDSVVIRAGLVQVLR